MVTFNLPKLCCCENIHCFWISMKKKKKESVRRQKKVVLDTGPLLHFELPALMDVPLTYYEREFSQYMCFVYERLHLESASFVNLSVVLGGEFMIPVGNRDSENALASCGRHLR